MRFPSEKAVFKFLRYRVDGGGDLRVNYVAASFLFKLCLMQSARS